MEEKAGEEKVSLLVGLNRNYAKIFSKKMMSMIDSFEGQIYDSKFLIKTKLIQRFIIKAKAVAARRIAAKRKLS
jgi:hypothetical protein